MEYATIKVLKKKPFVQIDKNWFPYRHIVKTEEFDEEVCANIEEEIRFNGRRKVSVYYNIEETDDEGRPTKILVGCDVKGKPYDRHKCVFNTIYDNKPLNCTHTLYYDPNIDPFIYKRFMEPETYMADGDD